MTKKKPIQPPARQPPSGSSPPRPRGWRAAPPSRAEFDTLAARVTRLERAHRFIDQPQPVTDGPSLKDLLRAFPGGFKALSEKTGINPDTLYKYARGQKHKQFPVRTVAPSITRAFAQRRPLGVHLTVERQRLLWEHVAKIRRVEVTDA